MKLPGRVVAGVAAILMTAGTALAADPMPVMAPVPTPMAVRAPVFDWSGLTVGVFGRYDFCSVCDGWGEAGIQAGYDLTPGRLLLGVEGRLALSFGDFPTEVQGEINGRLGIVLGRSILYATAGLGTWFPQTFWTVGGGAEVAIASRLSVFGEFRARQHFSGSPWIWSVGGGIKLHLGN